MLFYRELATRPGHVELGLEQWARHDAIPSGASGSLETTRSDGCLTVREGVVAVRRCVMGWGDVADVDSRETG